MDPAHASKAATRAAQQRAARLRTLIVGGLFSLLLGTGLLIGTSLLPDGTPPDVRIAPPSEFRTGRVLYALPSGKGCRHISFDNQTGEMGDLGTGPCEYPDATGSVRRAGISHPRGFSWNR